MANSEIKGATQRFAEQVGATATLTQYTKSGTDSYGDPNWNTSTTDIEVLWSNTTPRSRENEAGDTEQIDATFEVVSDTTVEDSDKNSDGRADQLEVDGYKYVVINAHKKNGIQHVDAQRRR